MVASNKLYFILALTVIPFALAGLWEPIKYLGFLIDVIVLLAVIVDFRKTPGTSYLEAERHVQERLSIGRENEVVIKITNSGPGNLQVRLTDDTPAEMIRTAEKFEFNLPQNSVSTLSYELTPYKRGAYTFGNITIRYLSSFGLFWRQKVIPTTEKIKVFSDLKKLHELSIKLAHSTELGELHQRKRGQGTDFASLREYTVGDDTKAIDWKATARRDRPVVRTYEVEQEQRLLILLDAGRMMCSDLEGLKRFDHALNAALCLALTGLTHNDQVGLGIFADKPLLYLPPKRGKSYMKKILESTFDVEPKMVEPDYVGMLSYFASAQKGRALIVVLTDLTDPIGSHYLLSGLASLRGKHLPFCVTLKDRQITQVANTTLKNPEEEAHKDKVLTSLYQRAIATDLLSQRELALSVLQRRGCLILDCPPQELSDRLVDSYLDVKTRGRL